MAHIYPVDIHRVYLIVISKVVRIYNLYHSFFFMVLFFNLISAILISNWFCCCSVKGSHSKYLSMYKAIIALHCSYFYILKSHVHVTANNFKTHLCPIHVTLIIIKKTYVFKIFYIHIQISFYIYLHSNNSSRVYLGVYITLNIMNTNWALGW